MSSTLGTASITGWSYDEVKAVNNFHNAFVGQSEYLANENGVAYCERGTSGVVLVNCSGTSGSVNVTAHNIKDGSYVDQITGSTFTVSGGRIKGTIGSTGIAVVYGSNTTDVGSTQTGSNIAYIELPSGWSSKVYCYAYDGITGEVNNGQWPGVQMTHVSGNIYKYQVPSNIQSPLVIFYSSDKYRYPADMEPGLSLSGSMIYQNGEWKSYKETSVETSTATSVYDKESEASDSSASKETTTQQKSTKEITSSEALIDNTTEISTDSDATTENQSTSLEEDEETSSDIKDANGENEDESSVSVKSEKDNSKEEGGFPWVVILLPIVAAGCGVGVFAWMKYKKKDEAKEAEEQENS